MADATAREQSRGLIDDLGAASDELAAAEAAVESAGEERLKALSEAYDSFVAFIDENDGKATGSGREAFQAYVNFQDELVHRIERLPDDLLAREAFEAVGDQLDKRRLSSDDMERARETLEPAAEKVALLEVRRVARRRYRRARSEVADRLRDVEAAIDERTELQSYDQADLDADVSPLRDPIEAYNESVREAFRSFKRSASARAVLDLLDVAEDYPLVRLEPAPEPLARYLRERAVGEESVATLLEFTDYSRSKLAHYVDDPDRFRATVTANRTYLSALDAEPLTVEWPPPDPTRFRFRARELIRIVDRFADEATVKRLHTLRDLARGADYSRLREAAVAQTALDQTERDRLREGVIAEELEALRAERDRLTAALETHPPR